MTTQEASELLKNHNEWRRSGNGEMASPTEIGEAIDILLAFYKGTQQRVSPQDTPAIEINPNPKGIDVWKDLYERYKLTEKEREEIKDYRERIDRDNKQYFPKKDI